MLGVDGSSQQADLQPNSVGLNSANSDAAVTQKSYKHYATSGSLKKVLQVPEIERKM